MQKVEDVLRWGALAYRAAKACRRTDNYTCGKSLQDAKKLFGERVVILAMGDAVGTLTTQPYVPKKKNRYFSSNFSSKQQ